MCRSYKACVSECSKSVGGRVVLRSRDDDLRGRGCLQVPKEVLMTICTSATDGIIGGRLESTNKGKEKSHRSSNWWKSVLKLEMSSGYVDPGLEGDDMSKVTQHFVKDTQHFVNAAVSIFGISVVGGTIPSVCRRWFISPSVAINRLVRTPFAMV
ncbi:hypothetical protein F2Q68_00000064 [Brassica cretica]|uniref:Uncharacterized protein n=1 Tax=Brassica cretica TaxID=69181 RepID=A0A8S9JA31_BRACR|nr:hypothetical protein F2Q68_00000064 [Brassica cretica]